MRKCTTKKMASQGNFQNNSGYLRFRTNKCSYCLNLLIYYCCSVAQSCGLSRVISNTTVQKHQFFSAQLSLLEKAMAPHSSTLAWKIPWTEEPGGLQSMGSLRVGHDFTFTFTFTFMHFLLQKFQGYFLFI